MFETMTVSKPLKILCPENFVMRLLAGPGDERRRREADTFLKVSLPSRGREYLGF
jgi:hypothetical protein